MAVPNSCTMLNTVLSSRVSRISRVTGVSRVSRVSAMVSVRFSGMFNMVQEFGTAVYRIAENFLPGALCINLLKIVEILDTLIS